MATPQGKGGISVLRISGERAATIAKQVLGRLPEARIACYSNFADQNGEAIDSGIAVYFPRPHSFTGEDVLELHAHGSPVVMDLLLQQAVALGARLAQPGEFSERAFLNDKLDLTQAEAIADLINSASAQAARSALRSMHGEFSRQVLQLNERLIELRSYAEASLDFPEEEVDFLADEQVRKQAAQVYLSDDSLKVDPL